MNGTNLIRQSVWMSVLLMAALFLGPMAVIRPFPAEQETQPPAAEVEKPVVTAPYSGGEKDSEVFLKVLMKDRTETLDLGTYLVGVLRAEMPAGFHPEALKAQAAAARTYTLYKMLSGGGHGSTADVCTDPTCCQAYLTEDAARAEWGEQAAVYEEKVRDAVTATDGQAVLYGGVPILAVFHSSSAGMTRNAGAVWQNDLPYLQAVTSPEAAETIPDYYSRVVFAPEELRERLQPLCPDAVLKGSAESWLTDAVTDGAGSVETVKIGGVTVKGSAVRSALGLRSACFEWETAEENLVFYVTGYGHGVGLSQYGANRMAQEGADWQEILTHYYTGVTVDSFSR